MGSDKGFCKALNFSHSSVSRGDPIIPIVLALTRVFKFYAGGLSVWPLGVDTAIYKIFTNLAMRGWEEGQ